MLDCMLGILCEHAGTSISTQGVHTLVAAMRPWPTPMSRLFFVWAKMGAAGSCFNDWLLHFGCLVVRHFECKDGENKKTHLDKDVEDLWSIFEINEAWMLNGIYHWSFLMVTCLTKGTRVFCKISMYLSCQQTYPPDFLRKNTKFVSCGSSFKISEKTGTPTQRSFQIPWEIQEISCDLTP